jgi:hypothetical protein
MHFVLPRSVCVLFLALSVLGCNREERHSALSERDVQFSMEQDGSKLHLGRDGVVYRESDDPSEWIVVEKVYDPEEFRTAYVNEGEKVFRVAPDSGKRFEVLRQFKEDFDDLPVGPAGLKEMVHEQRLRWGSFTLQSPGKPTVEDYVELRKQLLEGNGDFADARIEISSAQKVSGERALRCEVPPRTSQMVTCKSSLSTPLVYFRNGDDFWFEAYYFIEGAFPLTLADLECEFIKNHPGIRLRFYDTDVLGVELKALDKPQYKQTPGAVIVFPRDKWVRVRAHFRLSAFDGIIEVWQDDNKIIEATGSTLPFPEAIYNSLEIGASAYSELEGTSIVYVDDVRISDRPFDP